MAARLTQANTANSYRTDGEFSTNQVIERHVASHYVAPSVAGCHRNLVLAKDRFDGFRFDQRQFELRLWLVERSSLQCVAVALQSDSGDRFRAFDRLHRRLGRWRDVDRLHLAVPHRKRSSNDKGHRVNVKNAIDYLASFAPPCDLCG